MSRLRFSRQKYQGANLKNIASQERQDENCRWGTILLKVCKINSEKNKDTLQVDKEAIEETSYITCVV